MCLRTAVFGCGFHDCCAAGVLGKLIIGGTSIVHVCCFLRKSTGTIDVIGGGTATISRVEGRRRHNQEGNNIQVHRKYWKNNL